MGFLATHHFDLQSDSRAFAKPMIFLAGAETNRLVHRYARM